MFQMFVICENRFLMIVEWCSSFLHEIKWFVNGLVVVTDYNNIVFLGAAN